RETDLQKYPNLHPRLQGRHQIENIAVAIRAAECLGIRQSEIIRGVNSATWPGRLERIGRFVVDGAHNVPAVKAPAASLADVHPEGGWIVFGGMSDKQYEEMISILKPHAQRFIFTKAKTGRAKDPEDLQRLVPGSEVASTVDEAIDRAYREAPATSTILI